MNFLGRFVMLGYLGYVYKHVRDVAKYHKKYVEIII